MSPNFININQIWGELIVEECIRNGIDYFCVSPGSRSTPLTVAVARNPQAKSIICYDERGAAFHALGYARATGKPAVLVCTSGTASANYLPAVIEADVDHVPLLVLSADRPPELRDTMANQTINQVGMFGRYVRWFFDMPCPTVEIAPEMVLTTIDQAIYRTRQPAGPVHINCMFREPLAPTPDTIPANYTINLQTWRQSRKPYTVYRATDYGLRITDYGLRITDYEKGLLVIGQLRSTAEINATLTLINHLNWPVFPDITSGLRLGTTHPNIIHHFDHALLSTTVDDEPDTIIHIGGQLVSKRLLQFCQRVRPKNYILLKPTPIRHDPFHGVTMRIEAELPTMLSTIVHNSAELIHNHDWLERWQKKNRIVRETLAKIDRDGLSEMGIVRTVAQLISAEHALFIGNSMPIRDFDMVAGNAGAHIPVAANRGASGIDGNIATAIGFAVGHQRPTTIVLGDLALLHDLNSLSLLRHSEQPITIVVINNQGGGIFHFLPIAQFDDVFEDNFGTPHSLGFKHFAQGFGLTYLRPKTLSSFAQTYQSTLQSNQHTVIELNTDRHTNWQQHQTFQNAIWAALNN